ncbi:MAG: alpha-galactosidase, partial [Sphingopyxis sp.]
GAPIWRYWGPRLPDVPGMGGPLAGFRPIASFSLEQPAEFSIFPGFGMGWFGQSALLAHRDGADFCFYPTDIAVEGGDCADGADAGDRQRLTVRLRDDVAKLQVIITLMLDADCDALTVSTMLVNHGGAPINVDWLASACLPLPPQARDVRSFSGRHNSEFIPCSDRLGRGQWRRENRHGLTSHDNFPGAVVACDGTLAHAGLAYGAQLAWSGNHAQSIEWLDDGRYQWQLGEWFAPGEVRLKPTESLRVADVIATCSAAGWGGVARNFHAAIGRSMRWPNGAMPARPVHINTWEGFYFDHDETRLIALADAAADMGVERFVLDDGWFHRRDDDSRALGDWTVDRAKYPDGLLPLASHIVARGMAFGLWVEPEMINPDSDLFRAHPDWVLAVAGRPLLTARNQLVLDLTQPAVCEYILDSVAKLLDELPITYLKWDHNRDLVGAGDPAGRAAYRRQILAAYALFDAIGDRWPLVEVEACAGGGGRIDAGIARRTHRFWTSDCIDAVSRVGMQRGFLQFMPAQLMGSHVGAAPAHSTGRSQSLDFRAAVAMAGHFGVENNVLLMSADERARLAQWIGFYKSWRHLLNGHTATGVADDGLAWSCHGDGREYLLSVYRTEPSGWRYAPSIPLPFLGDAGGIDGGDVVVQRIDPPGAAVRGAEPWRNPMVFGAQWLRQSGLPMPPMKAEEAAIFHLRRL